MTNSVSNTYVSAHDPLCEGGDCTCTIDQMQDGHRDGCPSWDCDCDFIAKVRAEYVNPKCVWGEGECVPDCPSCRRMNEMLKERAAGDREGQRFMLEKCIDILKNISVQI